MGIMNDDVLMTWDSGSMAGNGFEVHGRMMSGGSEFRVNTRVLYHQHHSTIAVDSNGRAHVAWVSVLEPRQSIIASQKYARGEGDGDVTVGPGITEFKNEQVVITAEVQDQSSDTGVKLQEMRVAAEIKRQQGIAAELAAATGMAVQASSRAAVAGVQSAARTQATLPSTGSFGTEFSTGGALPSIQPGTASFPVGGRALAGAAPKPVASAVAVNTVAASRTAIASAANQSQGTRSASGASGATRVNAATLFNEQRPSSSGATQTAATRPTISLTGRSATAGATSVGSYIANRSPDGRAANQFTAQPNTSRSQPTITAPRPTVSAATRVTASRASTQMRTSVAQQASQTPVAARIVQNNGQFSMEWNGRQGMNYQVQGSADSVNWQNVGATKTSSGSGDSAAINQTTGQRYFRVLQAH